MNMPENAQVLARQWPAPKSLTREAMADGIMRDQMFREWWFTDYASLSQAATEQHLTVTIGALRAAPGNGCR